MLSGFFNLKNIAAEILDTLIDLLNLVFSGGLGIIAAN